MNKSLILICSMALFISSMYCSGSLVVTSSDSADVTTSGDAEVALSNDDFAGSEVQGVQPVSVSIEGAYYLQAYDDNVAVYHVHLPDAYAGWDCVYHNNMYWLNRGGVWYRTDDFGHPFVAVQASFIPPDVITYHTHPVVGTVYQQFHGEPLNVHVGFAWHPSVHLDYTVKKEEYHNYYSGVKVEEHASFSAFPPGVHASVSVGELMHARTTVPTVHKWYPAATASRHANAVHADEHAKVEEHAAVRAEEHARVEEHGAVRAEEHARVDEHRAEGEEHAAVRAEEHARVEEHAAVRAEEHARVEEHAAVRADIHAKVEEHAAVRAEVHAKEERKEVKKEIKKEVKKKM